MLANNSFVWSGCPRAGELFLFRLQPLRVKVGEDIGTFVLVERFLHFCGRLVRIHATIIGYDPIALRTSPSRKGAIFHPE